MKAKIQMYTIIKKEISRRVRHVNEATSARYYYK